MGFLVFLQISLKSYFRVILYGILKHHLKPTKRHFFSARTVYLKARVEKYGFKTVFLGEKGNFFDIFVPFCHFWCFFWTQINSIFAFFSLFRFLMCTLFYIKNTFLLFFCTYFFIFIKTQKSTFFQLLLTKKTTLKRVKKRVFWCFFAL